MLLPLHALSIGLVIVLEITSVVAAPMQTPEQAAVQFVKRVGDVSVDGSHWLLRRGPKDKKGKKATAAAAAEGAPGLQWTPPLVDELHPSFLSPAVQRRLEREEMQRAAFSDQVRQERNKRSKESRQASAAEGTGLSAHARLQRGEIIMDFGAPVYSSSRSGSGPPAQASTPTRGRRGRESNDRSASTSTANRSGRQAPVAGSSRRPDAPPSSSSSSNYGAGLPLSSIPPVSHHSWDTSNPHPNYQPQPPHSASVQLPPNHAGITPPHMSYPSQPSFNHAGPPHPSQGQYPSAYASGMTHSYAGGMAPPPPPFAAASHSVHAPMLSASDYEPIPFEPIKPTARQISTYSELIPETWTTSSNTHSGPSSGPSPRSG